MKFVITGANGHIGKRLIRSLFDRGEKDIVALVRSDAAARTLRDEGFDVDVQVVNYADAAGIRAAVGRCLLYTSPSPRDAHESRMPSSA